MPVHFLAVLCAVAVLTPSLQAQRAVGEASAAAIEVPQPRPDLAESLQVLRDTLRSLSSQRDLDAQYRQFLEAERLLDTVGGRVSPNEIRDLREKMQGAFSRLQLPPEVANQHQLTFRRLKSGRDVVYLSEAVVEGLFVTFLNDRAASPSLLDKWAPLGQHGIRYEDGAFISRQPTKAMTGITWFASSAFARWMSERGIYRLPSAGVITGLSKYRIDCWVADAWQPEDYRRDELLRMFGGNFQTLVADRKKVGELPEAAHPDTSMRYVITVAVAKRLYLKALRDAGVQE
jgi:hypothetical protein